MTLAFFIMTWDNVINLFVHPWANPAMTFGFLPAFGYIPFWYMLASCVILPYISSQTPPQPSWQSTALCAAATVEGLTRRERGLSATSKTRDKNPVPCFLSGSI